MSTMPTTSPIDEAINNKAADMYKRLISVAELLKQSANHSLNEDEALPQKREKTHELEAVVP